MRLNEVWRIAKEVMTDKLVIWGAGGHARVIADIISLTGSYVIVGFLDDVCPEPRPVVFSDAPILGGAEQLDVLKKQGVRHIIFGFGNCQARLDLARTARAARFTLATVIHPSAVVAQGVAVGAGSMIAAGAVVGPGACLGENVIVNTGATVDHDCELGDGVHICPGVNLAGNVTVGTAAWVGIGATVIQKVSIGAGATVGAGAVVLRDVPAGATVYGVPAQVHEANKH